MNERGTVEELRKQIKTLEAEVRKHLTKIDALQKSIVDWHSAMFGAICLILKPYKSNLEIEREHLLNLMPTRIDCLVIKKDSNIPIDLDAFRLFRKHNVVELKSYDDKLDERVLWHVIAYAATYISLTPDVPADDVTISIFRSAFPRKLMNELEGLGWTVTEPYHNIFYLSGKVDIPIQIVVSRDIGDEYLPLQILTGRAKESDVRKFAEFREGLTDRDDKMNADAVLNACLEANEKIVWKLKEDKKMGSVLRKVFGPELEQARKEGLAEGERRGEKRGARRAAKETTINNLYEFVSDGALPTDYAANKAGVTRDAFLANMEKAGWSLPVAGA